MTVGGVAFKSSVLTLYIDDEVTVEVMVDVDDGLFTAEAGDEDVYDSDGRLGFSL